MSVGTINLSVTSMRTNVEKRTGIDNSLQVSESLKTNYVQFFYSGMKYPRYCLPRRREADARNNGNKSVRKTDPDFPVTLKL